MSDIKGFVGKKKIIGNLSQDQINGNVNNLDIKGSIEDISYIIGSIAKNEIRGMIEGGYILNAKDFVPYLGAVDDVDLGDYTLQVNAFAIGDTPDPINYAFIVKKPISARFKLEAGTGFALCDYFRNGVAIAYAGLDSILHTDFSFATFGGTNSSIRFITNGVGRMRLHHNGNAFFGWNNVNNLFSIGLNPDTQTPTARLDINSDTIRLRTNRTIASATAEGNKGDICWDSNYIYVCINTNTWKRVEIGTW